MQSVLNPKYDRNDAEIPESSGINPKNHDYAPN